MDIQQLINEYTTWLKKEITFDKIGEYYEITTPYLNTENDYLQIYVRQSDDNIYFTDDSFTLNNLKMNGLQLTPARKSHLNKILYQYGIELNRDELVTKSSIANFAKKKHLFIQAMLRIDDIFSMSRQKVSSFFWMIYRIFLMKKKYIIPTIYNLWENQDLHIIMIFCFKEVKQNLKDCVRPLIIQVSLIWEILFLHGTIQ